MREIIDFHTHAFPLELLINERERDIKTSCNHILAGTDSAWTGQVETLTLLKGSGRGEERQKMTIYENALKL